MMEVLKNLIAGWPRLTKQALAVLLLLSGVAHGQAAAPLLRKDLKRDFGAVGDGKANDQVAFERAADFFNKRALTPAGAVGRAELRIPKGTYLVGRRVGNGQGNNVLNLVNCRNLAVMGDDSATTEIRYADSLRYGAFDPATKQKFEAPTAYFTDWNYGVQGGTCIVLKECDRVSVSDLSINGNSANLIIGGHWGDTGIQLAFDGIFVENSRHVTLKRLALHHLGRDGIQVLNRLANGLEDARREDILLENSTCDYNGRQGLSLTGVNGFRAVNCSFSHTGRVVVPSLGRALYSNPGAGVDLEPEWVVTNVRLEKCRFIDNAGQGIVSDRPVGNHPEGTRNIVVADGLLWGLTNWTAWISQPGITFENCRIYGEFVHGCKAATPADATRFVGCTFEDRPYRGKAAYGSFAFNSDTIARSLSFTNCRFIGTRSYLMHANPAALDPVSLFHLRSCTFLYDYAQSPQDSVNKPSGGNKLLGGVFSGNTVFRDGPRRTSRQRIDFVLGNPAALGTNVLRAPGSLRFLASNSYYLVQGGLEIGRQPARSHSSALVEIGDSNALVLNEMPGKIPELYIGPGSRLIVKKGGSLEILRRTKVTVAGQLIVEDGAYFFSDPLADVSTVGQGQLRIGPRAIKSKHPTLHSTYY